MLFRPCVEPLDYLIGLAGCQFRRWALAFSGPAHSGWRTVARCRRIRAHRPRSAFRRPVWCLSCGRLSCGHCQPCAPHEHQFARIVERGCVPVAVDAEKRPDAQCGVILALVGGCDGALVQRFELFERQFPEFGFAESEIESAEGPYGEPSPLGRVTFGSSISGSIFRRSFLPVVA